MRVFRVYFGIGWPRDTVNELANALAECVEELTGEQVVVLYSKAYMVGTSPRLRLFVEGDLPRMSSRAVVSIKAALREHLPGWYRQGAHGILQLNAEEKTIQFTI